MKTFLSSLVLLATPLAAQLPFTLETATELTSGGDFDGDGRRDLVIVDRESGSFRILTQAADGSFAAGEARPTGVPKPATLGVGKLLRPGPDTLAVTAPAWNAVNLLLNTDPPVLAPQTGLGPVALAVLDLPAAGFPPAFDDLMVATALDAPPAAEGLGVIRVTSGSNDLVYQGTMPVDAPLSHGRRVLLKTGVHPFGGFMAALPGGAEFRAYDAAGGNTLSSAATAPGLPVDADYIFGAFDPASPLSQFLFYVRGASTLELRPVAEPSAGVFDFAAATTFDLGAPIYLVSTVPFTGGAWLLVLFDGGATATLYDFDGVNAPTARQSFTAPPGESFTGGIPLTDGNLLLTSGPGGRSNGWQRLDFDGITHLPAGSGTWGLPTALSASATVFVFTADPFVNPDARLSYLLKAGDWTTSVEGNGFTRNAAALQYLGPGSGLGSPFSLPVQPFTGDEIAVPNQYQPAISIATFSGQNGDPRPSVRFSPPAGEYDSAPLDPALGLPVTLTTDSGSPEIFYRVDPADPWEIYKQPVKLIGDKLLEAYAGTPPGPITRGQYRFTSQPDLAPTAPVDANNDGLPDAWAKAFGLTNPAGDPDGDGFTNAQEALAGTDPRDAASVPSGGTGGPGCDPVIFIRIETDGTGGRDAVVFWPATLTDALLESSSDLVHWETVTSGIALHGNFFEWRTAANGRQFFRLAATAHCELALFITTEPDGTGGATAVLRWPSALTGAHLWSSGDLINWSPVTTGITKSGGFFERREPAQGKRFFQLRR